ncbi:MAG: alcohol dehydrogenase [Chloroflexi bacterium]|nr:alcohol dehydrogenase [Chloroflexi bacterium CFX1]MCK6566454.1 zinc-binding dehydrogenase [Anaerolineales bacterium]MCQ3953553.1 alcohol dehydrogenase [Chloroflexota bacterium]MDL1920850.1 zinc-binding dehydrogenase [Chloroflexi bacterium CFX5]NUQ59769.1 alcohol dehydrogenase catalytic domain-containing protein [Anaerolineales bacterium]
MKAVQFIGVNQPLKMREIPIPEIGARDVLVRVKAAGVCHSDAHYRAGISPVHPVPLTLGHEVAGVVERIGVEVGNLNPGGRVCLHYNLSCGDCYRCATGNDQFCEKVSMIGHYTDGGYAEYIAVPARNAIPLPDEIPFEQGATLMCASATAFHALKKSRLKGGETVAIFGAGGLGQSAVQLARAFGAVEVFAVDIHDEKLNLAAQYDAIPINAGNVDAVGEIKRLTNGKGVDVAVEMIGLPKTMKQALQTAGVMGRVVIVGLSNQSLEVQTYTELLGREVEIIGSNDHLLQELPILVDLARRGILDTSRIVSKTIPLDADEINAALDDLEKFGGGVRTVIVPASDSASA